MHFVITNLKIHVGRSHVKNLQKVTTRTQNNFVSIVLINKSIFFSLCILINCEHHFYYEKHLHKKHHFYYEKHLYKSR